MTTQKDYLKQEEKEERATLKDYIEKEEKEKEEKPKPEQPPSYPEKPSTKPLPKPEPKTEKEELLEKIGACIKEHDGESNIGTNHEYWTWINKLRSLK